MKTVTDFLVKNLENGNVLIPIIIVGIAVVFHYKKILEFFDGRKKLKIQKFTEALKCEQLTGLSKTHIENELVIEHFKQTTGLGVEKEFREALFKLHSKMNGELRFLHFKRALPHILFEDQKVVVKITQFDTSSFWFSLICGIGLAFTGLIILALFLAMAFTESKLQPLTWLSFGFLFLVSGFMLLGQTLPVYSARLINTEIKKLKERQNYPY